MSRPVHAKSAAVRLPSIGISANLLPPARDRRLYIGKTLQYAEEAMVSWVWRHGGLPVVLPVLSDARVPEQVASQLDGLVLTGGEDISPRMYGEEARRPEWAGNERRDRFETALVDAFVAADKPVLGICRGHQLINVSLGGSLYQDLVEDGVTTNRHRDPEPYDRLTHPIRIVRPSYLYDLYACEAGTVNTVHHQAIRELGEGLEVIARSADGVIEAVCHRDHAYLVGVQWHPEWVTPELESEGLLPAAPILRDFIGRVRERIHSASA